MLKFPSASPWPTKTVASLVLSLNATYGRCTGSPMVSTSNGGQPCQLRAVPLIVPLPGLAKSSAVQTNPNQNPVRRLGGSLNDSPGAPDPPAPSPTPACRPRTPPMGVVEVQRPLR